MHLEVHDLSALIAVIAGILVIVGAVWFVVVPWRSLKAWMGQTLTTRRAMRRMLARSRSRDAAENKQSLPPPGERLRVLCVWVAEIYPPSHVEQLQTAVKQLGLDEREPLHVSVAHGVRQARSAHGGWWHRLPVLLPKKASDSWRFGPSTVRLDLPRGVANAHGAVHTLTSAVTVLTIQFVFDDATSLLLDDAVRREYTASTTRSRRGGFSIETAGAAKERTMKQTVVELEERCSQWVARELPGAFARGLDDDAQPTAALIETEKLDPFREESRPPARFEMSEMLGLRSMFGAWKSDDLPGLRLDHNRRFDDRRSALRLLGRREDLARLPGPEYGGGADREALCAYLDDHLDGTIAAWAIHELTVAYHARIAHLRDVQRPLPRTPGRAIKALKRVHRALLRDTADARAVAADLVGFTRPQGLFGQDATDFSPADARHREVQAASLLQWLRRQIHTGGKQLQDAEARIRDVLVADANIASAIGNLRLQQSVLWLSVVVAVLAAVTLVVQID